MESVCLQTAVVLSEVNGCLTGETALCGVIHPFQLVLDDGKWLCCK